MAPSAELKERISKLVKEKKVFVVSKSYCPFCVTAKVNISLSHLKALQGHWYVLLF
jgi:hypothetical protein